MEFSPDKMVFWQYGQISINLTIVTTWGIMLFLSGGAWIITRKLSSQAPISPWQNMLEVIVQGANHQIREIGLKKSEDYLPFLGTLFIFIAVANLIALFPGCESPTASLSTTTALALCVFVAVPAYGIAECGFFGYVRTFFQPVFLMFPLHVMSELSRTLALAIRLFGNVMSEAVIAGILLSIAPFFFPVIMKMLGLVTGLVQAYIFAVLATVFISAAVGEE